MSTSWCQRRTKYTLSKFFQPFDPFNQDKSSAPQEDSVSARLMAGYGIVRQAGPGTYTLLPLGLRAQTKLEALIDREMHNCGCLKVGNNFLYDVDFISCSHSGVDAAPDLRSLVASQRAAGDHGAGAHHLRGPGEASAGAELYCTELYCTLLSCTVV